MLDTERSSMQTQIKKMEQKHQVHTPNLYLYILIFVFIYVNFEIIRLDNFNLDNILYPNCSVCIFCAVNFWDVIFDNFNSNVLFLIILLGDQRLIAD